MTGNEYQKKALRTASNLSTDEMLLNGVMGLCGEAGETIDLVKKHLFQGHPLNREKLIDELSDCCWYIAITSEALGIGLEQVMQHNVDKLMKRYPNGFSSDDSLERRDQYRDE